MKPSTLQAEEKFRELLDLLARLRSPDGCPWDRSQKQEDIAYYLIEEAYEVIEALDGGSPPALMEELGDLLFQILFLARMAEEAEEFDIAGVLNAITEKMIRRHPHVFGDITAESDEEVRNNWERIKKEVEHKGIDNARLFDGVPRSIPTLAKAQWITAEASAVGFDWNNAAEVLKKVDEELGEFRTALEKGDQEAMHDEAGDLLLHVGQPLPVCPRGCGIGPPDLSREIHPTVRPYRTGACREGKDAGGLIPRRNGSALEEAKQKPTEGIT